MQARMEGAAPIQAMGSIVDASASVIESIIQKQPAMIGFQQSLLASGLQFGCETALHAAISGISQLSLVRKPIDKMMSPETSQQELKHLVQNISALISFNSSTLGRVAYTAASESILNTPIENYDMSLAVLNGVIASGVIASGTLIACQLSPGLKSRMLQFKDDVGDGLHEALSWSKRKANFIEQSAIELTNMTQQGLNHLNQALRSN